MDETGHLEQAGHSAGPLAEAPLLEGPHPPSPPILAGPFRWVLLAHGLSGFAFWAFYGTVFAEAAFRFHAGKTGMAVLGVSLSIPYILGSLLQGLAVDRWSPKWLALIGYLAMACSIPLALVAESLPWLFASSFLVGAAFATIEPSRSALTGLLVDHGALVHANALLSVAFQLSLVAGTLGGGGLLQLSGADLVYVLSLGAALLPVLAVLRVPDVRQRGERPAVSVRDLRTGARTAWHDPILRVLLLVSALGWALINTFFVLEPLFVKETLHRGGNALLYLWSAHGTGALIGALVMTRLRRATGHEAVLVNIGVVTIGVGMLGYTGIGIYGVALASAAIQGAGFAMLFPPMLALIQRVVVEEQRGRVTSVFVALQESMGLLSSILVGVLAAVIVVRPTLVVGATLLAVLGLVGLRAVVRVRRSHRERLPAA
jgi:MFS family permease